MHPSGQFYTDKYFSKTRACVHDDNSSVVYGVFLRHQAIAAIQPALDFLSHHAPEAQIWRHFPEGAIVPPENPLFSYGGRLRDLVELETMLLQHVGFACISAINAYNMSAMCPQTPFLDMAARHCAPGGMIESCAYGAAIGSNAAKMRGAKGFIGSSLDITARYYNAPMGLGTMPHALIGLCDSTLEAVKLFVRSNPDDKLIVALVDYYEREYSDSLAVAEWFASAPECQGKTLGVRLDTHGGRFAEGLDYEHSVEIVADWMHIAGKWPVVRAVMGDEAYDLTDDKTRDDIAKLLFGTGVSAANIMHMRKTLNDHGHKGVQIVASSGFNVRKCRVMQRSHAPIDLIGTGSFLPDTLSETYATADIYGYNGNFRVKGGREHIFREVAKTTLV
jgi:nicotinate phosphoribosyltransferase